MPASQIFKADQVAQRVYMLCSLFEQLKLFSQSLLGTQIPYFILHRFLHQLDYQYADHPSKCLTVEGIYGLRNPDYFGYYRRLQQIHQSWRRYLILTEMLKLIVNLS